MTRSAFAAEIAERRLDLGLSQRKMAALICVSPTYMNQLEQGITVPTAVTVVKLAHALGLHTDRLFFLLGMLPPDVHIIVTRHPILWDEIRKRYGTT